jgi:acyl carrier protein
MNTNSIAHQEETPTRAAVEQAVVSALARAVRLPPEQIFPGSRLEEDLGLDSMALIHVNIGIEEQLGIALSICDAPEQELKTVQALVDFVVRVLDQARQEAPSC